MLLPHERAIDDGDGVHGARLPVAEGDVVAHGGADVELAGPGDALVLLEQLHPVRQPARGAGDGEQHREHLDREAHRLVDEPRVEVDVRVELARDEVVVGQRDLFELERDVEQRVLAGDLEDLVGGLLDDRGPRVVVLVHAVAEALQPALAGLHRLDELGRRCRCVPISVSMRMTASLAPPWRGP